MKEYQPIENYGIVGDLNTVALVSIEGSIDFMSFPHFDSPTIFARMLDCNKGGFFQIKPSQAKVKTKQIYLTDTNILLTRYLFEDGVGEVKDFMPITSSSKLIRRVTSIKGKITYRMQCCPRFHYGQHPHRTEQKNPHEIIFSSKGNQAFKLWSSVPIQVKERDGYAVFTLKAGETADFILEDLHDPAIKQAKAISKFVEVALVKTLKYWKEWAAQCTYDGRWKEMVIRSALCLKLLISNRHGSIIAAPTFGLPEQIGGKKNWDYRYAWIRDAAFTIYSLMLIGYKKEAECFMEWIEKIFENSDQKALLHPLYGFDGRKKLQESVLDHFEGYMGSAPVLIGNAASTQRQIDIIGELVDAIYLYDKNVSFLSRQTWLDLSNQLNWVLKHWRGKGSGIWEVRGKKKEFLYSRLMCWVALDRAIKIGNRRSFPYPNAWVKARDEIYQSIYDDFWDPKQQAFVQYKQGQELDASTLLMPLKRFISPKDPKWLSTLAAIEQNLVVDCLVYRYNPQEAKVFSFGAGEGTFTACSFWFIESLSKAGQVQKAEFYFDKMVSYANHLGLYAEQLGPQGDHLGNFPQAFTHLALISAAYDINRRLSYTTI